MTPHLRPAGPIAPRTRRRRRAATIAVAPLAAVAAWAVASHALGVEVRAPAMAGDPPALIPVGHVVSAAVVAALGGWALLAALERVVARWAWLVWQVAAKAVLALSLWAPLTGPGLTAAQRWTLAVLHVVVALVAVTGYGTTAPRTTAARLDALEEVA